MTRLRWTGSQKKTFMNHGVGEVEPGRAFSVPDEAADSFLAHEYVELADAPAKQPRPPVGAPGEGEPSAPARARKSKAGAEPVADSAAAPAEPA